MAILATAGCDSEPPALPANPGSAAPLTSAGTITPRPGDPTGSTDPASIVSTGRLTAALLTEADLPAGFTRGRFQQSPAAGVGSSMQQCAGLDPMDSAAAAHPHAEAVFQSGIAGPYLVESLASMPESDAAALVTGLRNVTDNCASFGGEAPGGMQLKIAIGPLTFPRYGDDTAAFRMTATVENAGAALYAHVVVVRRGGLVVMVTRMELGSPDVAATEQTVRSAYEKASAAT